MQLEGKESWPHDLVLETNRIALWKCGLGGTGFSQTRGGKKHNESDRGGMEAAGGLWLLFGFGYLQASTVLKSNRRGKGAEIMKTHSFIPWGLAQESIRPNSSHKMKEEHREHKLTKEGRYRDCSIWRRRSLTNSLQSNRRMLGLLLPMNWRGHKWGWNSP